MAKSYQEESKTDSYFNQSIVSRISANREWYDDNTLTKLLEKYVGSFNIRIIPICRAYEDLQLELEKIKPDIISGLQYVIPLNINALTGELCSDSNKDTNHWVGLHIVCSNSNKVDIVYIDPTGRAIAPSVAELITETIGNINELAEVTITEPLNGRSIQYVRQISGIELEGNFNDCGPMLVYALACEVRAIIDTLPYVSNRQVSESLGTFLRQSFAREDDFNTTTYPGVSSLTGFNIAATEYQVKESALESKTSKALPHSIIFEPIARQTETHIIVDYDTLIKLLEKYVGSANIKIIPICRTYGELSTQLGKLNLDLDISGLQYVIPLNINTLTGELCSDNDADTNHWVGLHIVCSNSSKVDIAYIDPMGRAIASGVAELITAILRYINELVEVITITESLNYRGIQYVRQAQDGKFEGNLNDCSPMLVYALACEVRAIIDTLPYVNSKHVSETLGDFLRQSFAREDDFNSTIHPGVLTLPEIRIQQLAHKESTEELKQLVEVLHELGQEYISLADSAENLNTKLDYYNEAAVFYSYIITIITENDNLKSSPEVVEHLKQTIPVYEQFSSIQSKLIQATGGNQDTILEAITETNIDQVSRKDLLQRIRHETEKGIKFINETSEQYVQTSREIFIGIAGSMQQYLASLYEESQNILGEPPCAYTVIGLGSMALQQMTPYSDLEFAIIVENYNESTVNYFRKLSQLVHFKVIALGETIIPTSKYGCDLSHLVHKGVNFDLGGKTPLGRIDKDKPYELIGTVDWLMHYVRNDADKATHIDKNLPYILEKVCCVYEYGNESLDESLFDQYESRVHEFLEEEYRGEGSEAKYQGLKNYQVRALKVLEKGAVEIGYLPPQVQGEALRTTQFKGDLEKLAPIFNDETEGKLFNVKDEIYRLPDRMIYNLGMYFGIDGSSAWDTIGKLRDAGIISETAARNLMQAVTFATTLRLKTYIHNGGQRDGMSTYELALDHLSAEQKQKLKEQTFYIEDTDLLHDFYYTMLRVIELVKGLCSTESRLETEEILKQDNLYVDSSYNKGIVHARFLEYEKAIRYLELAKEREPENLKVLKDLWFLYNKTETTEEALALGQEILNLIKNEYHDNLNHPDIAYSYNNLGEAYHAKGKYDAAIEQYQKALEIFLIDYASSPNHPDNIAYSYNNLKGAYRAKGEYYAVLKQFQQVLAIKKLAYASSPKYPDIAVAGSYNNLGNAYLAKGKYDTALEQYQKALAIKKLAYASSPNHPDIATSYNSLGVAYCAKGEYDKAIEQYQQALAIKKLAYASSPNHSAIATSYNNLGAVYNYKGKYDTAIEQFQQALAIVKVAYASSPNHPDIATSYNNLGDAYHAKGKYDAAIEQYQKALEIFLIAYASSPNHPDIATSYNNLGAAYWDKGEYDKAIEQHQQALAIKKLAYASSPNHPDIAYSYNNLGVVYSAKGEYDKAIEQHQQALAIVKVAYASNPNHPHIATSCHNLGNAYSAKGEYDTAIEQHQQALAIRKIAYASSPNHPAIGNSYNGLGLVCLDKGEYEQAHYYASKVLDISINHGSFQSVAKAKDIHEMAIVQLGNQALLLNEVDKAREYYKQINPSYEQIDFNSGEFIKLQFQHADIAYKNNLLLAAINCQLILVKLDPQLQYGNHYHNLGCFYACTGNVVEANEAFIQGLTHSNAAVTAGLQVEYANFLIANRNNTSIQASPEIISSYLFTAVNNEGIGGLGYRQVEKDTVPEILKGMIIKKNSNIEVNAKALAYYLLIKYPEYRAGELGTEESLLGDLQTLCDKLQDEVSFRLLADIYSSQVGDEELSRKYTEYASLLEQVDSFIAGKFHINENAYNRETVEELVTNLNSVISEAMAEQQWSVLLKSYAKLFHIYTKLLTDQTEGLGKVVTNLATLSLLGNDLGQFLTLKLEYGAGLNMELVRLIGANPEEVLAVASQIEQQLMQQSQVQETSEPSEVAVAFTGDIGSDNSKAEDIHLSGDNSPSEEAT